MPDRPPPEPVSGTLTASLRSVLVVVMLCVASIPSSASLAAQDGDLDEDLRVAAQFGDVERVRELIAEGASVDAKRGPFGETALMAAAQTGNLELVRLLIEAGADLQARDDHGNHPLHYAFVEEIALLLLERMSDEDLTYEDGVVAPLILIAGNGFPEATRILLDRGADPNLSGPHGETPLTVSAAAGHELVVRILRCAGASTSAIDGDGRTAQDLARASDYDRVAAFLESSSCEPGSVADLLAAHALERQADAVGGRRASADSLYGEVLALRSEWLGQEHPAVVRIQSRLNKELRFAAQDGDLQRVRGLVEMGSLVNAADYSGLTALMLAAQSGVPAVVGFLLERGADPNARDSLYEATPLYHALVGGSEGSAILLLDRMEDVNAAARDGVTALHAAAFGWPAPDDPAPRTEFLQAVDLLLRRGADPDARAGPERRTPLMIAADRENAASVRLLYCGGASAAAEDGAGRTARTMAREKGFGQLASFLESPTCDEHANQALIAAAEMERRARSLAARGRYSDAVPLWAEVLRIRERALGAHSPDVAVTLGSLAEQQLRLGELGAARQLLEKAREILEAERDPEHPDLAANLGNLAIVLEEQGDFEMALPMVERALAIMQQVHGAHDEEVATQLDNLARLHVRQGNPEAADSLYERALQIRAVALDESERRFRATALSNFAFLKAVAGDHRAADTLYLDALDAFRGLSGPEHPDVARVLNQIGELRLLKGDIDSASRYFEESLVITERRLGPDHVQVAAPLDNLAIVDLALGQATRARQRALRAAEIVDAHIAGVLSTLSAAEQRAFLRRQVPLQTTVLLLAFRGSQEIDTAYAWLSRWKGLLAHLLRRQAIISSAARRDPAQSERASELDRVRAELAAWHQRAGDLPVDEWQALGADLTQRKEHLERELARAASDAAWAAGDVTGGLELPALRDRLPPGAALVDVYRYGGIVPSRYGAILSFAGRAAVFVDMGTAGKVDSLVIGWRREVTAGREAASEWQRLEQAVWSPIARALGADVERLWVSPDGMLVRLPWSLLAEGDARTGHLQLSQVDSPRELAALLAGPSRDLPEARTALLVGDVDFDAGEGVRERAWRRLPGTAAEIESLSELARDVGVAAESLTGPTARKEAVTELMSGASVVHLATHGFFYSAADDVFESRGGTPTGDAERSLGAARNPLVESGIVLAGANVRDSVTLQPRGLLTAEELVSLELPMTDLVVLSACETGRGEEITGQGVMGLRAALLAAGARSVLISLWKVPDESTALLMQEFYRGLWLSDLTKAEALRRAQDTVRTHLSGAYRAPLHWAAWVLAGEAW